MSGPTTTTDSVLGPPLIGALLRMPVDLVRGRMLEALHRDGFDDVVSAHFAVLNYPGPDGRRPADIAAQTGMSKQALHYLLGQLETLGYIERHADPDDQRAKRVSLTDRGYAAGRTLRAAVAALEDEWAGKLGRKEFDQLKALLRRLNEAI
jgi:DNA-binding MarR family transcriptional regulator